jgi:vancomycin resistance protein YoaR
MTESPVKDIFSDSVEKKHRYRKITALVAAVMVLCGTVAAVSGKKMYEKYQHDKLVASVVDTGKFYSGTVVQGVELGGMTMQQALIAVKGKQESARGTYSIKISNGSQTQELTQNDMTFSYNTEKVLKEAYAYARSGDRERRFQQVNALKTEPKSYSVEAALDETDLKAKVLKIAAAACRDPVNPTVASFDASTKTFAFKDGVEGLTADGDALWADVKAIAEGGRTGAVKLQEKSVPFNTDLAEVKSHMQQIGTYGTTSTNAYNGTYNMSRALAAVNGTCVPAGGTFSFLAAVGPCDRAHGYLQAGAILNGKLIQEYGGGICQASTTLYGAALRAGMKIVERSNHSMPSSYCAIGQDATVSYPGLDLKFQNTSAYPVYILTKTKGRALTATFYGYQPADYDTVSITSQVTETIAAPAQAKYTEDAGLASGTVKLDSKAHTGYKVTALRVYSRNGKTVKTEKLSSSYYKPQPAYYSYGKGTDLSKIKGAVPSSPSSQSSSAKPSSGTSSAKPSSGAKAASSSASSALSPSSPSSGTQNGANAADDDVAVA